MQRPVINMISQNSVVLAAACPGSVAYARIEAGALQAAASAPAFVCLHGKRVMPSVVEFGKAVEFPPANGDLRRDEQLSVRDVLGVYGVQAQVEEQRWSVLGGTSLIAPTARMSATQRGASGPYPWRPPV